MQDNSASGGVEISIILLIIVPLESVAVNISDIGGYTSIQA